MDRYHFLDFSRLIRSTSGLRVERDGPVPSRLMGRKHFLDIPSHPMRHFFSKSSLLTKKKTTVFV